MRGTIRRLRTQACLLLIPGALAAQGSVEMRRVADGVYVALQPASQRFDDSNATIVLLTDGVLVIDTQNSPARARQVIAAIRDLTALPVRWVVNTHWHGDHVQGNEAYRDAFPGVEFIGHAATARDIRERAAPAHAEEMESIPGWLERARTALLTGVVDGQPLTDRELTDLRARLERREAYYSAISQVTAFIAPDHLTGESMTLSTEPEVRLMHLPGHTDGDMVVYIPGRRVLVTGDLLDDLPFTGHGSPHRLVATIRALDGLDFDFIVPGHGSVREGRTHLQSVLELFESINRQVDAAAADGLDLEATTSRVDLSSFRERFVVDDAAARYWGFFMSEAIRRAWEETTGNGVPVAGSVSSG